MIQCYDDATTAGWGLLVEDQHCTAECHSEREGGREGGMDGGRERDLLTISEECGLN